MSTESSRCRSRRLAALATLVWAAASGIQAGAPRADSQIGEVAAVDASSGRLTLKTDSGAAVAVGMAKGGAVVRAKPGAKSLAEAVAASFEEIAVGDRVLVRGLLSEDGARLAAQRIVVMARDDIARKQEAERADWRRRGVLGTVTDVDLSSGQITLQIGHGPAAHRLLLPTSGRTVTFRRYAPDSVRFADAQPSVLAEVRVGDELRALGERRADDDALVPEQVVFGSFRLVAGSVTGIDPARHEVTVRDDDSGRKVTVAIGPDARLRHLPPEMAARLARRRQGTEGGPRGDDLLERMPHATLADLERGDRILVSGTRGDDASRLTAIALVAGLEALGPSPSSGRTGRGPESLPPELLDLGMSLP